MKLIIRYPTKERNYLSECTYQNISKIAELEAIRIIRIPCGRGKSATRYYYRAVLKAPDDAEFVCDGTITKNISRNLNKKFDPKKLDWAGNFAEVLEVA